MAQNSESDELVTVVLLFRHGSRNPIKIFNNTLLTDIADKPDQFGELTKEGKQEMYNLGAATREKYRSILGPKYSKKYFKISSSGTDRTLMSAQLFAAGVYPPSEDEIWHEGINWHPMPVFEVPSYVLACYPHQHMVPSYREEMKRVGDELVRKLNETGLIDYISEKVGEKVSDAFQLAQIADTFIQAERRGIEVAGWVRRVYPEPLKGFFHGYLRCLSATKFRRQMYMGGFFYEIVEHMDNKITDRSAGPNLLAYSGHDSNIVAFLDTFEMYNYDWPQCGGSITMELWKRRGEYIVDISYSITRGAEPVSIKLQRGESKFDDFKDVFKKLMISREEIFQYIT